jgi:hypothetical protein
MTRKNDKRVYTIKEIKPIEDPSKFNMAFPVLFPNTDYFKDLNSILNSYGIALQNLSDVNYDIEEYFKNIKENPMLNCIVKESDFKVSIIDNEEEDNKELEDKNPIEEDIDEEDNEYIDIVVSADNNELVFGIKYNSTKYILEDFQEETSYDISLVLELDFLKFYFTGSYCFIEENLEKVENGVDKVKNKSKVKRFFVYLD